VVPVQNSVPTLVHSPHLLLLLFLGPLVVFHNHLHTHRTLSPCTYTPRTMFSELLFLAPMPPLPSVPIVLPHLCLSAITVVRNLPHSFLPLPSFLVPLSIVPFFTPIDSHLDYWFTFDLHTCGTLRLSLANFLLVLHLPRS